MKTGRLMRPVFCYMRLVECFFGSDGDGNLTDVIPPRFKQRIGSVDLGQRENMRDQWGGVQFACGD